MSLYQVQRVNDSKHVEWLYTENVQSNEFVWSRNLGTLMNLEKATRLAEENKGTIVPFTNSFCLD